MILGQTIYKSPLNLASQGFLFCLAVAGLNVLPNREECTTRLEQSQAEEGPNARSEGSLVGETGLEPVTPCV